MTIKPIRRLLVANRGEIARRVIRSAHEMGISTAAIYADGDVGAPFVRDADTAIALNGTTSAQTYLNVDKVLDACRRVGADAVHPGYGFLSENAASQGVRGSTARRGAACVVAGLVCRP